MAQVSRLLVGRGRIVLTSVQATAGAPSTYNGSLKASRTRPQSELLLHTADLVSQKLILPSFTLTGKAYFQLSRIPFFPPCSLFIKHISTNITGEQKEIIIEKQILTPWSRFQRT